MVNVLVLPDEHGKLAVALVMSADSVFLTVEGTPTPGVALNPPSARLLAIKLIEAAKQVEDAARKD